MCIRDRYSCIAFICRWNRCFMVGSPVSLDMRSNTNSSFLALVTRSKSFSLSSSSSFSRSIRSARSSSVSVGPDGRVCSTLAGGGDTAASSSCLLYTSPSPRDS
eukprot:TRINITY_DN56896_c0_g1_i1.p2 TRINITY_DN56896_c0_g1~~TRINITY_DN56896_c0_g1_i1.p2  ORF type:complete len:104 (+),score=11.61 TRINITY_DN56896_c0_g1_i1:107-418(+)